MMAKHWIYNQIVNARLVMIVVGSLSLTACQMPSYSSPTPPSSSSGSSSSSVPPTAGSEHASDREVSNTSQGASSNDHGNSQGSGDSTQDLDQALDKSLEGFDNSVGNSASNDGYIDILSPSGNSRIQPDDTDLSFEQGDHSIIEENTDLAQRASSESDSAEAEKASAENANAASENRSSQSQTSGSIPIPEDIGDGRGDNIVQRQIREAAIKEKDPELRERLWDEYRKTNNL